MITRIEIDGFKTFQDFTLELAPFQVIVGPNGAGKSNLFDALRLLSCLAGNDLHAAFSGQRGDAVELFSGAHSTWPASRMRLAVELLVERTIQDDRGNTAELGNRRLRYELEIGWGPGTQSLSRPVARRESLTAIDRADDSWLTRHAGKAAPVWRRKGAALGHAQLISTEEQDGIAVIVLHQDGEGRRKVAAAEGMERTVLSGVNSADYPHAFAAREELCTWQFLHLNPNALRRSSPMYGVLFMEPDGANLPAALLRMRLRDPGLLNDVARDLANLVPEITRVWSEPDPLQRLTTLKAATQGGHDLSAQVLSDGTLRLLALATLRNDPDYKGLLCIEEPDNGLHPARLGSLVELLRGLWTDLADPDAAAEPLRQLLVTTHSPLLISQDAVARHVLFAHRVTRIHGGEQSASARVTKIMPVWTDQALWAAQDLDAAEVRYSLDQVLQSLGSAGMDDAVAELRAASAPW